jgi:hypothetical protein
MDGAEERQVPGTQFEVDAGGFARREFDLGEGLEFPLGAVHARHNVTDVHLHDFLAGPRSGVGQSELQPHDGVLTFPIDRDVQVGVGESGVGQAMPEGVADRHVLCVVVAVSDV